MFYSPIEFFPPGTVKKIKEDIKIHASKDYYGWSERFNYVARTDICCLYYADWVWRELRKQIHGKHVLPLDWIFRPWRIHKFSPQGFYAWHTDDVIRKEKINSVRTRTIIINLDHEYNFKLNTTNGYYNLRPGNGIQIPIEDYYEINIDKNERLEHYVLTTWGMRSKLFN